MHYLLPSDGSRGSLDHVTTMVGVISVHFGAILMLLRKKRFFGISVDLSRAILVAFRGFFGFSFFSILQTPSWAIFESRLDHVWTCPRSTLRFILHLLGTISGHPGPSWGHPITSFKLSLRSSWAIFGLSWHLDAPLSNCVMASWWTCLGPSWWQFVVFRLSYRYYEPSWHYMGRLSLPILD